MTVLGGSVTETPNTLLGGSATSLLALMELTWSSLGKLTLLSLGEWLQILGKRLSLVE